MIPMLRIEFSLDFFIIWRSAAERVNGDDPSVACAARCLPFAFKRAVVLSQTARDVKQSWL
jgi:hypothetical protein